MQQDRLPDPVLITRAADLGKLAQTLSQESILAVDTESNSLHAYQEQVCLVQFSTVQVDYLIDPLVLRDLSALGPIFADPHIEKIFHAAEYDLICLRRDFGFSFTNLFDTMLAARILGRDGIGLGTLLEAEFDVHLDKRHQRANWGQRPLPPHLLSYARLDTHYLVPLRYHLHQELESAGRWPLAVEDFRRLCSIDEPVEDGRLVPWWHVNGDYDLTPQQYAVLQELCTYRDRIARRLDRPLFKVIGDRTLLAIAEACPSNLEELKQLPGMTGGQVQRHGRELLARVQRGLNADPVRRPRSPRPDDQFLARIERLREWRKGSAQAMNVESDVVLPRDLLVRIAERNPRCEDDLAEVLAEVPWRLDHFGRQILEALAHNPRSRRNS